MIMNLMTIQGDGESSNATEKNCVRMKEPLSKLNEKKDKDISLEKKQNSNIRP
jgi:hypothetical protein